MLMWEINNIKWYFVGRLLGKVVYIFRLICPQGVRYALDCLWILESVDGCWVIQEPPKSSTRNLKNLYDISCPEMSVVAIDIIQMCVLIRWWRKRLLMWWWLAPVWLTWWGEYIQPFTLTLSTKSTLVGETSCASSLCASSNDRKSTL